MSDDEDRRSDEEDREEQAESEDDDREARERELEEEKEKAAAAERAARVAQEEEEERQRREEEARKQEEKKKREAEEASKKRKPGQKRKGLGGLSPEKKKLLKQLIMQKAADEMKAEMKKRQEEKEKYLKAKVEPLDIDGCNESQLETKVKQMYEKLRGLESEKYDWEEKLRRQEFEINELTIKVNDVKGKFVKPVLKKVSKTDISMAKLTKAHGSNLGSIRTQLKSTGQNKFALDDKPSEDKADWRAELKSKEEEAAEA